MGQVRCSSGFLTAPSQSNNKRKNRRTSSTDNSPGPHPAETTTRHWAVLGEHQFRGDRGLYSMKQTGATTL